MSFFELETESWPRPAAWSFLAIAFLRPRRDAASTTLTRPTARPTLFAQLLPPRPTSSSTLFPSCSPARHHRRQHHQGLRPFLHVASARLDGPDYGGPSVDGSDPCTRLRRGDVAHTKTTTLAGQGSAASVVPTLPSAAGSRPPDLLTPGAPAPASSSTPSSKTPSPTSQLSASTLALGHLRLPGVLPRHSARRPDQAPRHAPGVRRCLRRTLPLHGRLTSGLRSCATSTTLMSPSKSETLDATLPISHAHGRCARPPTLCPRGTFEHFSSGHRR